MPFNFLSPDSPFVDKSCGGTLGFLRNWILTNICVTQAYILASTLSNTAHASPSLKGVMLPYRFIFASQWFGKSLNTLIESHQNERNPKVVHVWDNAVKDDLKELTNTTYTNKMDLLFGNLSHKNYIVKHVWLEVFMWWMTFWYEPTWHKGWLRIV